MIMVEFGGKSGKSGIRWNCSSPHGIIKMKKEEKRMDEKLKIPVGITSYKDICKECYYVDKTSIIASICEEPSGSALLFARPRRFGKTLLLSMLDAFFRIGEDNSSYFRDKAIYAKEKVIEENMNRYPLIHISMKDVYGSSAEECILLAEKEIASLYSSLYGEVESSLEALEKEYCKGIISGNASKVDYYMSLEKMSSFLEKAYGRKTVLLIDEYDTPIRNSYEKGYYQEAIVFFKQLYGRALKENASLRLSVLTGILQIAKESLFSGLNNLNTDSILDNGGNEAFGFSEEETEKLLSYYGLSQKKEEVREWYDGYLFGEKRVYNPLSVLTYVKKGGIAAPYWVNTGENAVLSSLMGTLSSREIDSFASLLGGEAVLAEVDLAISYLDLDKGGDALYSYLLAAGYLTIEKKVNSSTCLLKIPNREIMGVFVKEIRDRYLSSSSLSLLYEIKDAFASGNGEKLERLLGENLLPSFSYFDFGNERSYQAMLLTLSSLLLDECSLRSESNEGSGRADIIAFPKEKGGIGIVIEVKCHKGKISMEKLKQSSQAALRRIKNKDYDEGLRKVSCKCILHFGVAFCGKNVRVSAETLS